MATGPPEVANGKYCTVPYDIGYGTVQYYTWERARRERGDSSDAQGIRGAVQLDRRRGREAERVAARLRRRDGRGPVADARRAGHGAARAGDVQRVGGLLADLDRRSVRPLDQ